MSIETILSDGVAHFGAGMTVSLLDYISYRIANRKDDRILAKKQCFRSIELLLDANQPQSVMQETDNAKELNTENVPAESQVAVMDKNSLQYANNVDAVRSYLINSGLVKLNLPFAKRMQKGIRDLFYHERINDMTNAQKFGVAVGLEVIYDTIFGFHYYTVVQQQSPIAAIATNIYQIPLFFVGLWTGNIVKKGINWVSTSGEEYRMDKALSRLIKETPIVDMVVNYEAPENVREELESSGIRVYSSQLTRKGNDLYKRVQRMTTILIGDAKDAAGSVMHYGQRLEERRKKESDERRERFDDITKGR